MSSRARRIPRAALALGVLVLVASGCAPEPAPSPTESGSATASPSATPTESSTPEPEATFAFPASCDDLYSPEMRATLDADVPPLNDPGTTLISTENSVGLDVLETATQTIRCSWGPPSERGLATNVTTITDEQRDELFTAFEQSGFAAEDLDGGTLHSIEQEVITQDDELVTKGEFQYLRDDVWISTRWINVSPEGYTQDIIGSLWG